MSRDLMEQVVNDFGREIGAELNVDEDAYCCLAVGDNFQIHLKFNEHFDGVIFYSEIGEVPTIGRKEILRHYVMQNGSIDSDNLTFAFDDETKNIGMLCQLSKTFLNLDNFKKILEKIIKRYEKEHEDMGRFLQGELPKDDIRFIENENNDSDAAIPTDNMQFIRM